MLLDLTDPLEVYNMLYRRNGMYEQNIVSEIIAPEGSSSKPLDARRVGTMENDNHAGFITDKRRFWFFSTVTYAGVQGSEYTTEICVSERFTSATTDPGPPECNHRT